LYFCVLDVKDIYSSIFDHKPTVCREVDYFVKEFEESRKDREVDKLFKILERVTELKETELENTQALGDIHLPKLAAELQVAESIANKLNKKRSTADKTVEEKLVKHRQERVVEWDSFVHDMTAKCVKIDGNYKDKQEEIRRVYKNAEDKLLEKQNKTEDTSPVSK